MSNNRKNNKKKKNINNYSIEALEPRLMMNADTAENAANEYITSSEFVKEVAGSVEQLDNDNVQIDGKKLSVSNLFDKTFSDVADKIVLAQTDDTDWYSVSLDSDLKLDKQSIDNLSVNVGHEVSVLDAEVNTTVKINDLKLKIEKAEDGSLDFVEKISHIDTIVAA